MSHIASPGDCVISVQEILDQKGERIISVAGNASVAEITHLLFTEKIGTVLVIGDAGLEGIISERDIIAALSRFGKSTTDKLAVDIMTAAVVTCPVTEDPANMLALMSRHTIRHLPIMNDDRVVGLLSVRDILNFQQQMLIADLARREEDAKALGEAYAALQTAFEQRTEEFRITRDIAVKANNAKTVFLANMSHELRTPLNAIIGFSEVMTTDTTGSIGSQQYRDYVGDINEAGHLLLSLINDPCLSGCHPYPLHLGCSQSPE